MTFIHILNLVEISNTFSLIELVTFYFAVLGILVTLISITGPLNPRLALDLIIKYYMKDRYIRVYLAYFIFSLPLAILVCILFPQLENFISFSLSLLLFLTTLSIIAYYIKNLNVRHLYETMLHELGDPKKSTPREIENVLEDLINNIAHFQKYDLGTENEKYVLKQLILSFPLEVSSTNSPYYIEPIIKKLLSIKLHFFDTFVDVLYKLNFDKPISLEKSLKYQHLLTITIMETFTHIQNFNPSLNTSGLYIQEFFGIQFINEFKRTKDDDFISKFKQLAENTISDLYKVNSLIIDLSLKKEVKMQYLFTQLGALNKSLQYLEYMQETDLDNDYYKIKFDNPNETENRLVDRKLELIKNLRQNLYDKKSALFFLILEKINRGELEGDFFDLALKIYKSRGFYGEFVKYRDEFLEMPRLLNYDDFDGGVQSIPGFNFMRYKLLMLLYEYKHDKSKINMVQEFEKENFLFPEKFNEEIDNLNVLTIEKFFDMDIKTLKSFSKNIKEKINIKRAAISKDEGDYLRNSKIEAEYVKEFYSGVKKIWNGNQEAIGKFLNIKKEEGGGQIPTFFGFYILHPKEVFLKPFFKNVFIARDFDYGNQLVHMKNKSIFDQISALTIINTSRQDFMSELRSRIKPNKNYYIAYNRKDFDIYFIPEIIWDGNGLIEARIELNGSNIYFLSIPLKNKNVLFEEKAIIIKQFSRAYKEIEQELYTEVNENFSEDEINKLINPNKEGMKSKEDIKKYVKILIAEKFKVEIDPEKEIYEIKFEEREEKS